MKINKGVTLIALVITIIVLLILAGVSIATLTGDNGILTQAQNAKETYENATKQEKIQLGDLSDFKIGQVSNAVKGKDLSILPTKESYVGDFIKISTEDLKALNLDFEGDYYVNPVTGEVYDINGDNYNDITYHSIEELQQILYCDEDINVKRLLKMKYEQLDYLNNNQQHSNGAIATYTRTSPDSSYNIIPYFSCSAATDMLIDIGSFGNIKRYISWHFNHINTQPDIDGIIGTIYDYKYEREIETAKNEYDSVDSYCALFIDLLYKYANATGDKQLLIDNKDKIDLVVTALDSMYKTDINLTQTKESYNISYLMDNTESYARI